MIDQARMVRVLRLADLPWRAGKSLDPAAFAHLRRQLMLDCCKWDPQVGDVSTLAPFPIILGAGVWRRLSRWAEELAAEAAAAEAELLARPDLHATAGIPWRIRRVLRRAVTQPSAPAAARIIRFDFHWTTDGWRISEANADVPGGFTEASSFAALMARHFPGTSPAGDPAVQLSRAIAHRVGTGGGVALLTAPGYMEDQQVVAYLAGHFNRRGIRTHVCDPRQLRWRDGAAQLDCDRRRGPIDAIVRFFQAEWLAGLPRRSGWPYLFVGGRTPLANPGSAILIESKRFPMVWDNLCTRLPTWRRLLPVARDPRTVNWRSGDDWVFKAAFCNTGDEVAMRSNLPARQWRKVVRSVFWRPRGWVAQRRFEPIALATPLGLMNPCLGVYVIDGRAAGIYGRMTPGKIIDYSAIDVAVLVENDAEEIQ